MDGMPSGPKPRTTAFSPYRTWKGQMRRMKTGFSMGKKLTNPLSPVKVGSLSGTVKKIVG